MLMVHDSRTVLSSPMTSTPASIYAEFILEGRISEPGVIAPELLDRAVRDEFIAELGRREMVVTRKDIRRVN